MCHLHLHKNTVLLSAVFSPLSSERTGSIFLKPVPFRNGNCKCSLCGTNWTSICSTPLDYGFVLSLIKSMLYIMTAVQRNMKDKTQPLMQQLPNPFLFCALKLVHFSTHSKAFNISKSCQPGKPLQPHKFVSISLQNYLPHHPSLPAFPPPPPPHASNNEGLTLFTFRNYAGLFHGPHMQFKELPKHTFIWHQQISCVSTKHVIHTASIFNWHIHQKLNTWPSRLWA